MTKEDQDTPSQKNDPATELSAENKTLAPSRRDLFAVGAALGGVALVGQSERAYAQKQEAKTPRRSQKNVGKADMPGSVVTNNGTTLPFTEKDGVKIFHLIAEPVTHEIAPGLTIDGWGYNGQIHGPTIEVTQGDRCRFYVENRLPESTSVHWHGIILENGMDGVGGLTQPPIDPGQTFRYEFTFGDAGTFMYHPHVDEMTQIAMGMVGMIVVHPKRPRPTRRRVRDYALMLHEWDIPIGTRKPNTLSMNDFNVLTMNAKAYPATAPIIAETGDLVRIRLGNLSPMDHHPIHIHGHRFRVVQTDGGDVPKRAQWPETTVLVPTGSCRVIEFVADNPGDWPFHCHMTHHMMNQMGHRLGNMIGADLKKFDRKARGLVPGYMSMGQTGMQGMGEMKMPVPKNSIPMLGGPGPMGYIDMGGMFSIVKIRNKLTGSGDPGWYKHPKGSIARLATTAELRKDGIKT